MKLLYSICVPCITYACDVVEYSSKDKMSIKEIRESFGFPSIMEIFAKRKSNFELYLPHTGNSLLTFLLKI